MEAVEEAEEAEAEAEEVTSIRRHAWVSRASSLLCNAFNTASCSLSSAELHACHSRLPRSQTAWLRRC